MRHGLGLPTLSLFSGVGLLDLAIRRLGFRSVCFVERDAFAQAVLVARMEDASLDQAPIWADVTTFDGVPWRGVVDCVAGGFPCQDISVAGRGVGIGGARSGLWNHFARIVGEVRPAFVLIENVPALVGRGLLVVLRDLAALGFDAEWGCLRASAVGAPHRRDRFFLLAYTDRARLEGWASSLADAVADSDRGEVRELEQREPRGLPDGVRDEGEAEPGEDVDALVRVPFPPARDDADGWRAYLGRYPALEPAVRRGPDGGADWLDRLRVLGNGVVPAQAELAFRLLAERALRGEP